jgi:hypothetical protein
MDIFIDPGTPSLELPVLIKQGKSTKVFCSVWCRSIDRYGLFASWTTHGRDYLFSVQ